MADNTIDTLELEVISNSNSAISSLDNLSKKLIEVKDSFSTLSDKGVRKLNKEIGTFATALKSLSHLKIKMPVMTNVTRFTNNLESLSNAKTSGISDLVTASENLKKISTNLSSLNGTSLDLKSTKDAIKDVLSLGQEKNLSKSEKLKTIGSNLSAFFSSGNAFENFYKSISSLNGKSLDTKPIMQMMEMINAVGKKSNVGKSENLKTIASNLNNFSSSISSIKNVSNAISQFSNIKFDNSKLTSLINSISRLTEANTLGFNSAPLKDMANSLQVFSQIPDVSNSINRLVSSIARLASAGGKVGTSAAALPELTTQLTKMIKELSRTDEVSQSINLFVQSISRLATAGSKAKQTSEHLQELASELMQFFNVMKNAPNISENTIRMAEALAQLASSSSKANTAANRMVKSFSNLSGMDKASGVFDGIRKSGQRANSSVGKLGGGFRNLIRSAAPFFGLYEAFSLGKKSIDIASDLTEVQNVVDNAFGEMKYKIEDLANVSIKDFGMSELTAKNIASRYQAMGTAMGFSTEKMSDMSVELTKLAADMASFYNVSQKDVAQNLQAIFTGEQEPLMLAA